MSRHKNLPNFVELCNKIIIFISNIVNLDFVFSSVYEPQIITLHLGMFIKLHKCS